MADRVFFCPGMSPNVISGYAVPPQMIEALLTISRIPIEHIEVIGTALEAEDGFLSEDDLGQLVDSIVDDESFTSAVVSALYNLQPQRLGQTMKVVADWRLASKENAEKFSVQALADLEAKLPRLIRDYPVLVRARKARRLRSILGKTVQGVELICDARPVYNAKRDSIEGLIPLTTMKIVYEGQDEETREIEVMLSREAVSELAEKLEKLQQKLDILDSSITHWIPNGLADSD
jgi:hypothetical protein